MTDTIDDTCAHGAVDQRAVASCEPYGYFVLLIAAWYGAWLLFQWTGIGALSSRQQLAYWTIAKLLIWLAPIVMVVRLVFRQRLATYLGLVRPVRGTVAGRIAIADIDERSLAAVGQSVGKFRDAGRQ